MKSKLLTKSSLFIVIITIIIFGIVVYIGLYNSPNLDPPNTQTLSQGTQMRFEDLSIGLININDNSAWLSINKNSTGESTKKLVHKGDKVDVYGYIIEINSVHKSGNLSSSPGSSHGYIKFVINK